MLIVQLLIGAAALFFGRRLFWLFVGIVGFMVGPISLPGRSTRFPRELHYGCVAGPHAIHPDDITPLITHEWV